MSSTCGAPAAKSVNAAVTAGAALAGLENRRLSRPRRVARSTSCRKPDMMFLNRR
jgi:hypothetical protein